MAEPVAASGPGGSQVPLRDLTIEQLANISGSLQKDVEMLTDNVRHLIMAQNRLATSRNNSSVGQGLAGREAMVPMTDGIFLPGRIDQLDTVLVDLGTGYFVEKTPENAVKYFTRRLATIKENIDKASALLTSKERNLEAVRQTHQAKQQQQQQQQHEQEKQQQQQAQPPQPQPQLRT